LPNRPSQNEFRKRVPSNQNSETRSQKTELKPEIPSTFARLRRDKHVVSYRFGVRGHVRAFKAATRRRSPRRFAFFGATSPPVSNAETGEPVEVFPGRFVDSVSRKLAKTIVFHHISPEIT
jgi:hypothetical protein